MRLPSIVPPVAVPSFAVVATASPDETTSPTPSAATSPSPTPGLDVTWTQVPISEQEPHLAWIGDRFVLADTRSGSVRTSPDGVTWQPVQPGDSATAYVDLATGRSASWQNEVVGWLNPEDGPDTTAPLPKQPSSRRNDRSSARGPDLDDAVQGPDRVDGNRPMGIVAESHSALDFDHWVTKKLGLRTNNDWTMHVKSVTFQNGVLEIKLNNRPGLKVVWADQGFEPGDLGDSGFGWYSADGEHWTEMAPRDNSDGGSTLPTRGYGQVVGVSDGFIASGALSNGDCCDGMWYSARRPDLALHRNRVGWTPGAVDGRSAGDRRRRALRCLDLGRLEQTAHRRRPPANAARRSRWDRSGS